MLSAKAGGASRTPALGIGTAYSGSKRSELFTETTVRGSTRVEVTSARGSAEALATASAGAATGALIAVESRGTGAETGAEIGAGIGAETAAGFESTVVFAIDSVGASDAVAGAGVGAARE